MGQNKITIQFQSSASMQGACATKLMNLEGHTKHLFYILCFTEIWLSDGFSDNLVVGA